MSIGSSLGDLEEECYPLHLGFIPTQDLFTLGEHIVDSFGKEPAISFSHGLEGG